MAATFCWKIRYALTPVFGADFPALCIEPGRPDFMSLRIDAAIVKYCEETASMYRIQALDASLFKSPPLSTSSKYGIPKTPKSLRPKMKMTDIESGYGTDSERSLLGSPISTNGSDLFVPVNTPRSTNWAQYQYPTPKTTPSNKGVSKSPKTASTVANDRKSLKKREALNYGCPSEASSTSHPVITKRRKVSPPRDEKILTQEALAAHALMELHRADRALGERNRAVSRRLTIG